MANAYIQNIMHLTFHVKNNCYIDNNDLPQVIKYIGGIVHNLGGILIAGGGIHDHIHLLVSVPKNISLADYLMKIKANSSRWLKTVGSQYQAFAWQDGYGAFSVSASKIETVKTYIANQAEHHRQKSYTEEVEDFFRSYDLGQVPPLRGSDH